MVFAFMTFFGIQLCLKKFMFEKKQGYIWWKGDIIKTSAPIGALKCNFSAFLGKYNRPLADQPII